MLKHTIRTGLLYCPSYQSTYDRCPISFRFVNFPVRASYFPEIIENDVHFNVESRDYGRTTHTQHPYWH